MPSSSTASTAKSSKEIAPAGSGDGAGSAASASASLKADASAAKAKSTSLSGASKFTAGRGAPGAGAGELADAAGDSGVRSDCTLVPMRALAALAAVAINAK